VVKEEYRKEMTEVLEKIDKLQDKVRLVKANSGTPK
jgi:hypothetical protein